MSDTHELRPWRDIFFHTVMVSLGDVFCASKFQQHVRALLRLTNGEFEDELEIFNNMIPIIKRRYYEFSELIISTSQIRLEDLHNSCGLKLSNIGSGTTGTPTGDKTYI
ncbi:hypothetical protein BDR06DRAFT_977230 [Suillus hirtellus]|nr:hypothetical protein BDR06DRAFT_977230 [Suillus hirtellus]